MVEIIDFVQQNSEPADIDQDGVSHSGPRGKTSTYSWDLLAI